MALSYNNQTKQVTLCARRTCCPKVELVGKDRVKITDDNGNTVIMNIDEARLMNSGIDLLKEKSGPRLLNE